MKQCPSKGGVGMWAWLLLAGALLLGVKGGEGSIVYFANGSDIQELKVVANDSQPHSVVAGLADAEALDYNPLDGRLYWTDSVDKRISRVFANGSGVEAVVTFDLTRPAGIAVDPLGGNIFFSDKGQKRITVATQTGKYRRILLWNNLTSPEALQLDLSSGVLFWLDTGPPARVEKARVDGTERSTVISLTKPGTYHGLAIDAARHRLYWTRTTDGRAVIEHCSYDGSGGAMLAGTDLDNSTPYAVTVWQDTLIWSQLSSAGGEVAGSIFSRQLNGKVDTLYANNSLYPYDLVPAFSGHNFSEANPCKVKDDSCKICVVLSSTERRCLCESGETWSDSKSKCTSYLTRAPLLVGYSNQIRVLVEADSPEAMLDFQLPIEVANVTSIDYNSRIGMVWSEDHSEGRGMGVIKFAKNGSLGTTVRSLLSVAASSVSLIYIDEQKLVFWVDTVLGLIGVVDVEGKKPPYVIFDQGLDSPRALVLFKESRLLVWVEQADAGAAIFYSPVSGGWKQKLYMLPTGSRPVAMAINETTETLYWVDIGLKEISHAQWNASQPQRLVALEDSQYFSDITLRNGYLYLTDRSGGHIQRIFPGGVNPAFEEMFEGLPAPRAAVAVLKNGLGYDLTRCGSNYCLDDDHHYCFPRPFVHLWYATCKCTSGYQNVGHEGYQTCDEDPSYYIVGGTGVAVFESLFRFTDSSGVTQFTYLRLPSHSLDIVVAHYRTRQLLWYDSGKEGIYSVSMEYHFEPGNVVTATSPRLLVNLTGHGPVGGMSMDWLGGNVFWTLPEKARIDYMAVDGLGHRVFKSGLAGLTRLAVASENRTVFWVQRQESREAVWQCLFDDCSSPQVLYWLEEGRTIQKLFFAVQVNCLFSVVSFQGSERVTYYNFQATKPIELFGPESVESVAAWGQYAFALVNQNKQSQLVRLIPQHGQSPDFDDLRSNTYHDITILSPISQRGFHVCQFRKAGCSHVCLPQQESFVCQCPPHMVLEEDGKTCTGVKWPFILVSTSTELLLASYKAQSTATLSRDMLQAVPFTGKDIRFIQYDPHSEEVFVLDWGTQMLIALSKLDDWRQRPVVSFNLSSDRQWSRLQYDYLGGNLFWNEQVRYIEGVGRAGGAPQVIEYDRRTRFMDIAVDPHHGRLYWISLTNYNSIGIYYRNITSSSGRSRLPVENLRRPMSLVYDEDRGDLFWVDSAVNTVSYYNSTSQTTHELGRNVTVDGSKPLLRVAEEYVYWFEPRKNAIVRNRKSVGNLPSVAVTGVEGVTDFVVTLSHYPPSSGVPPCLQADCEYWCAHVTDLATHGTPSYKCACPYGFLLDNLQRCEAPSCSQSEVQCRNSKQCISSAYECDGHQDCPDGTDESPYLTCPCPENHLKCYTMSSEPCIPYKDRCAEYNIQRCTNLNRKDLDCIECDPAKQFMCADQTKCVPIRHRCEVTPTTDCLDGSDEKNCNTTVAPVVTTSTTTASSPQGVGDQPAILATAILLSLCTVLVLVFMALLLVKYLHHKRAPSSSASQNGSSALLTRMSVSTAQGGEPSQSEVSFCSLSTLTKETHVSSATETDMPCTTKTKPFYGSDLSVETMVTTDPLASDPPPSPITQKSIAMVPQPSIGTFDPEYAEDPDLPSYCGPAPSVNFSYTSEYDKFSSVSEVKPLSVHRRPPLKAHFQSQLQRFDLDYLSGGNPSDVVSLASNSHCTPPPPPSPVTLRSTCDIHKDDVNYASSSTMV